MLKKAAGFLILVLVSLFALTNTSYAAEQLTLNHDNRVWDTSDYCLRVYNVSIGLSEIQSLNKDKTAIEELIIKTADPDIRVRNSAYTWKDWTRLAIERLSFDFSRFSPVPNGNGYEVTVTAPAIQRNTDSTIPFTVYVVDDLPKPIIATVSFFGTNISDMHIEITNSASLALSDIETPVKDGYTFKGWYLDKDCTEPFLIPNKANYDKQIIAGNLTLYPKWEKNPMYAIIHFANNEFSDLKLDITNGTVLTTQITGIPARDGYTFKGWYLDKDCTEPFLIPNKANYDKQIIAGNLTLYPKWEKNPMYAIIHFANNEFSDLKLDITNGTVLTTQITGIPARDGYTFKGWYLDKDCTEPFLIQGSSEYAKQAITGDLTLYSKWQLASAFLEPPQEQTKQERIQERPKAMVISEKPGALAQKPNLVLSAENAKTPLHETKTQEKIVQNNEQDTVAPEPVTFENKTTKSKIGVPMYEYLILVLFTATAVCFGHSIFLDLRVLKWYKRKKIAYMAKHEVTS